MIAHEQSFQRLLHAIADPTRRRILQALKTRRAASSARPPGLCARDLQQRIRVSQPTISHHMAILEQAGLVQARKQAQWRWYQRDEAAIRQFGKTLRKTL